MKDIRILTSQEQIDDACEILYKIYVEKMKWQFAADNPAEIKIVHKDDRKLLVDKFNNNSVWFGVFIEEKLVGCARVQGRDENSRLELEDYESSKIVHQFLPLDKSNCVEAKKFAILPEYVTPGIVRQLLVALFKYCQEEGKSIIVCTHNNFLKNLFSKIEFPLIMPFAFRYEPSDPKYVHFYFADHEKGDVAKIVNLLELDCLKLIGLDRLKSTKQGRRIFEALKIVAPVLPTPLYWQNRDGIVMGINELGLNGMGSSADIIGKTPYEFYPKEIADPILRHHNMVMEERRILSQEERINDITTGEIKYFSSIKAPLYDDDGSVIGIVGTSIDITNDKESERLRNENIRLEIENRYQNEMILEQNNFRQIINQAVHDIRSPIASLLIVSKYAKDIPPEIGDVISGATKRINDIANNLLSKYRTSNEVNSDKQIGVKNNFQVSLALQEILSEKKYEFYDSSVEFRVNISSAAYLTFLFAEEIAFKRMISNLINNAVEAIEHKSGVVEVHLDVSEHFITVTIEDNGKGIPDNILDKLCNDISVTDGKREGYGIGFAQVRETLQRNRGRFTIDTKLGKGTTVILTFDKTPQPAWVAEKIEVKKGDTVIILDDDPSIYRAWEMRFRNLFPDLRLKYFEFAKDAINHMEQAYDNPKENVLLLADYELVDQEMNGLDVIKKSNIDRSILVTNRFSNREIQKEIKETTAKMLPKLYVSEVAIHT